MRMLLVLHRATGTSQKAMKEHPVSATTELILTGRVLRARPDRDSRKVSPVPGDEVVVFPGPLDNPGWCSLGETMMWDKAPRAGATQISLVRHLFSFSRAFPVQEELRWSRIGM